MGAQHQPLSLVPPSTFPPDLGVGQGPRLRSSEAMEPRAEALSGRRGALLVQTPRCQTARQPELRFWVSILPAPREEALAAPTSGYLLEVCPWALPGWAGRGVSLRPSEWHRVSACEMFVE